jgi:hypothetical protein
MLAPFHNRNPIVSLRKPEDSGISRINIFKKGAQLLSEYLKLYWEHSPCGDRGKE